MKEIYKVTLAAKQVARICEEFVAEGQGLVGNEVIRCDLPADFPDVIVRVSEKRKPPTKSKESA